MVLVLINILKWVQLHYQKFKTRRLVKKMLLQSKSRIRVLFPPIGFQNQISLVTFQNFPLLWGKSSTLIYLFFFNKGWQSNAFWVTTAQALGKPNTMITLMKAGHTVITPSTPQSSSRVSDCYILWIYQLFGWHRWTISSRVNVCL